MKIKISPEQGCVPGWLTDQGQNLPLIEVPQLLLKAIEI